MSRLIVSLAVRAAARKAGLQDAKDRRVHRHLLSLDLRLRSPGAFCEPPKPLVIGTGQALAEILIVPGGEYRVDDLRAVLRWWTGRRDYLAAIVAGSPRVDLDGRVTGMPDPEQRVHAAKALAALDGGR